MRKTLTLTALALTAACGLLFSVAPAEAQIAGNPSQQHTVTPYIAEQLSSGATVRTYSDNAGPFAPVSGFAAGPSAPVAASGATTDPHSGCRASQDFNGRYSTVCGP